MNGFKRANNHLTHAQIVNEYESKLKELGRCNERLKADNERLKADNDRYRSMVGNTRCLINNRIRSLKNSLKKEPDKIKQAQLKLCLDIRGKLK